MPRCWAHKASPDCENARHVRLPLESGGCPIVSAWIAPLATIWRLAVAFIMVSVIANLTRSTIIGMVPTMLGSIVIAPAAIGKGHSGAC